MWKEGMEAVEAQMETGETICVTKGTADGPQMENIIGMKKAAVTRLRD